MAFPTQYQVNVLDPATAQIRVVFDSASFYSLRYSRVLNNIGQIALLLPSTAANRAAFTVDAFIEVYRTSPLTGFLQLEGTYLTRNTQRFRIQDDEQFLVGGFSLEHFLSRRIIDPADDPAATLDGYSAKSGAADVVMHDYANQQIGPSASAPRQLPGLTVAVVNGVGNLISARYRYDNLFKVMTECQQKGRVDFKVVRGPGATFMLNIAYMGADSRQSTNFPFNPWVGLAPIRTNLTDPSLLIDRNTEQNFIYAMGQGKGKTRALYQMAAYGQFDSPYNRIEFYQDIRNINPLDTVGLQTAAIAALEKKKYLTKFTFIGTGQEPGNVYRKDWDIGDYVTALWDEFTTDLRMTGIEIDVKDTGETMKMSVLPITQNA